MVLEKRKARIGRASILVLDEVDMLLDESYYGDIRMLVQGMGALRQAVFASATGASPGVRDLADNVMGGGYQTISSSSSTTTTTTEEEEEEKKEEEESIELPTSLRHGLLITPPAKILDNLRRFLHTDPKPELYVPLTHPPTHSIQVVSRVENSASV